MVSALKAGGEPRKRGDRWRAADGGRILNLSSGLARFTLPGYAAYAATLIHPEPFRDDTNRSD